MKNESAEQPEQLSFFPEDEEFKAMMEEIRKEKPNSYFPENDEALKELARLRLADKKAGKKSFEYHGRNSE